MFVSIMVMSNIQYRVTTMLISFKYLDENSAGFLYFQQLLFIDKCSTNAKILLDALMFNIKNMKSSHNERDNVRVC